MTRFLLAFALVAAVAGSTQTAPKPATQPPAKAATPQSAPKQSSAPAPPSDTSAAVPSTVAIITVKGVCGHAASPAGSCTTTVTKEQFEKLLNALNTTNQTIAPGVRRNLAQAYVELLAYTQAAEKAGVDKDEKFLELMRLLRMRTLADVYRRDLEEQYRTPPDSDIQAYYNQNLSRYEEIKLDRIFIPSKNSATQNKDDWEKKAAQLATDVHDRAAKGEDIEKLQKEAYSTLGLTIAPPNTVVGSRRKGTVGPDEQELFGLKAGEVSKVEQEPAGYIIYKVESRQTLPLEQVKDEISRELFRQKLDAQLKSVTGSVQAEFNDQYFGPPAQTPPAGARNGAPENPRPSAVPPQPSANRATQPPKAPPQ